LRLEFFKMKVLKFGGSSVGSAEAIARVKNIISDLVSGNERIIVVCSAFGGFTIYY